MVWASIRKELYTNTHINKNSEKEIYVVNIRGMLGVRKAERILV
jgi:hypothetical protein